VTRSDDVIEFNGHRLEYHDSNHAYYLDGERVPSASTIAAVEYQSVGGLINWAHELGTRGIHPDDENQLAKDCGTAAHDALEQLAKTGTLPDAKKQPERVRGAVRAIAKWALEYEPEFLESEVMVASPQHGFAGRYDLEIQLENVAIVDLKSTKAGLDWERFYKRQGGKAFVQLAGYAIAKSEWTPAGRIRDRYILHVTADGEWNFEKDHAPVASEDAFLAKLAAYRADQARWRAYKEGRQAA
jgi:hypothetical protein